MALSSVAVRLICTVVLVAMFFLTPSPMEAQTADGCEDVIYQLIPCMDYLTTGQNCTSDCCSAFSAFNATVNTTAMLQASCSCLTWIAGSSGVNATYAAQLPSQCGVAFPYAINNQTNCSAI